MSSKLKIILVATAMLLVCLAAHAQGSSDVHGKVVDGNGEAVIGATVYYEGTSTSAMTDLDGNYSIPFKKGGKLIPMKLTMSLPPFLKGIE